MKRKILNSTQRSRRVTTEKHPFGIRMKISSVTVARIVNMKSLAPNDSDLTNEWEVK